MSATAVSLVQATSGFVGSIISTSVMYPLEVTKTRVQSFGGKSSTAAQDGDARDLQMNTMVGALKYTWRTEGIWGLCPPYAPGWFAKIVDAGMFNFVFWFWFSLCKQIFARYPKSFLIDSVTGIIAACINRLCTHPFENIAQRIQTILPHQPKESFLVAGANIVKEGGVRGLWKGLLPGMLLCINPTIDTLVYFRFRDAYLARRSRLLAQAVVDMPAGAAFMTGIFSKACAATICFPMTRLKVMGTTQRKSKKGQKLRGTFEIASDLLRTDGIKGFYYGVEGQVFNASVKQGLTVMLKERIEYATFRVLLPSYLARMSGTQR